MRPANSMGSLWGRAVPGSGAAVAAREDAAWVAEWTVEDVIAFVADLAPLARMEVGHQLRARAVDGARLLAMRPEELLAMLRSAAVPDDFAAEVAAAVDVWRRARLAEMATP